MTPGGRDSLLQLVDSCAGEVIGVDELRPSSAYADIVFSVRGGVSASVGGRSVLTCDTVDGAERGLVGFGVSGDGGELRVTSVAIRR